MKQHDQQYVGSLWFRVVSGYGGLKHSHATVAIISMQLKASAHNTAATTQRAAATSAGSFNLDHMPPHRCLAFCTAVVMVPGSSKNTSPPCCPAAPSCSLPDFKIDLLCCYDHLTRTRLGHGDCIAKDSSVDMPMKYLQKETWVFSLLAADTMLSLAVEKSRLVNLHRVDSCTWSANHSVTKQAKVAIGNVT